MEIISFDIDIHSGVRCPKTGIEIDFQDEDIVDYIGNTFVVAVISSLCPESCAIGGGLSSAWETFYAANVDELDSLEDIVEAFPGPYKALEVINNGMACGPVTDTTYYVVPEDANIEPIA